MNGLFRVDNRLKAGRHSHMAQALNAPIRRYSRAVSFSSPGRRHCIKGAKSPLQERVPCWTVGCSKGGQ